MKTSYKSGTNGGYKVSILFFLILMMIVLPLGLSLRSGQADAPKVIDRTAARSISQYYDRTEQMLRATAENAPNIKRVAIRVNDPRRPS